jgi:hypothetical protein
VRYKCFEKYIKKKKKKKKVVNTRVILEVFGSNSLQIKRHHF